MAAPIRLLRISINSSYLQFRSYHKPKVLRYLGFTRNVEPEEVPPEEGVPLRDILATRKVVDAELDHSVNIGVPFFRTKPAVKERLGAGIKNKRNGELEKAARLKQLKVPLDDVESEWYKDAWPHHFHKIATHYGLFRDLFNGAHFYPDSSINAGFEFEEDSLTPVHLGNKISPSEAATEPYINLVIPDTHKEAYHTLILTSVDGHLKVNDAEYLHWFVGNIPGDGFDEGHLHCDYLPPIPPCGTGFHRYAFLLFRHDKEIDYRSLTRRESCSLDERTFRTCEFYRSHEQQVTPVAMSFFQTEWDSSIQNIYHNVLDMKEPSFEYRYPPCYFPPQKRYPGPKAFDRYFDRYRDKKDLAEEVMKMKLDMITPFKPYSPKYKYPIVHLRLPNRKAKDYDHGEAYVPSWLLHRQELMHRRMEQFHILPKDKKD